MAREKLETAVIGAGPAGLGAGYRLNAEGRKDWRIFEASSRVGGLASSRVDQHGFTWDLGGHVIFSSDPLFNAVVDAALGSDALRHTRKSYIRLGNRFIPFPLQNNIHRLPAKALRECLDGLEAAQRNKELKGKSTFTDGKPHPSLPLSTRGGYRRGFPSDTETDELQDNDGRPAHFAQWIPRALGAGLAKHFMLPYNRKLWAHPLEQMGYGWIDGRIAVPAVADIKRAIRNGADDHGWGPNAGFRFPLRGGTGGLFANIAKPFWRNIAFRHAAVRIDERKKRIHFANGATASYGTLVTTAPLDFLVKRLLTHAPAEVKNAAGKLRSNSGWMVGIGINRKIEADRCWVYFPDEKVPFYRATYFSHYSPLNVPRPGKQTSIMCEISSGPERERHGASVVEETIAGLIHGGLMRPSDRKLIVSTWKMRLPYLYPIPTLDRDEALGAIEDYLSANGIRSVGRFGGWRYERGNMDHAFLAGHSAAE